MADLSSADGRLRAPIVIDARIGALLATGAISLALVLVQLALGEEMELALVYGGAALFGLLAATEAGLTTALGIINAVLVARFLLGAYAIKNLLMHEPISRSLHAPLSTGFVMLLGFAGLYLGTLATARRVRPLPIFRAYPSETALLLESWLRVPAEYGGSRANWTTGAWIHSRRPRRRARRRFVPRLPL